MRLAKRHTGLLGGGSDGWGVFYAGRKLAAAGEPVIELTIGEHDVGTDRRILDAMHRAATAGHTGYAAVPGIPALRDAIAARITQRTGTATTRDNVLVTPGGQAALLAAHHAVLDEGETALFCDPYYATYPGTLRAVGAHPVAVPTRAEDGFQLRAEAIRAAVTPETRSLLVNSPNNPTGAVYSRATLEGIAGAVQEAGLWLISDEVYDSQVWEGSFLSPRALPGMAERTLVVGSLSKSHAMTGSRLGWIVGPEQAIAHLIDLATVTTYGVPGYIQEAGLFALGLGPGFEAQIAAPFRRRRDLVARLVGQQQLVRMSPAQGGMYVLLDIRATGLDGETFARGLLERHRVAVMPGESFGTTTAGHLRVALTVDDARLETAIHALLHHATELADA
jgi:arginine:pyruvate transaminase